MNPELAKVREWAQGQLDALQEPPWARGRYQHLIKLIDQMLAKQSLKSAAPTPRSNVVQIGRARSGRAARNQCVAQRP